MPEKIRLDVGVHAVGLAPSREKARAFIQAGLIQVNGVTIKKTAHLISEQDEIRLAGKDHPYVSRGGLKLEKALLAFPVSVEGDVCADIGASTGGFTDCLLQHGAQKVYAMDVGYGQLDWSLRNDERVIVKERCNARYMEPAWFDELLDFACMDVAFISIKRMLEPLVPCLKEQAQVVALIKPQFEAGRENVGKKGVVRDARVHIQVILDILQYVRGLSYTVQALDVSPITGPQGNIEFLLLLQKDGNHAWEANGDLSAAERIVNEAQELHKNAK